MSLLLYANVQIELSGIRQSYIVSNFISYWFESQPTTRKASNSDIKKKHTLHQHFCSPFFFLKETQNWSLFLACNGVWSVVTFQFVNKPC